MTSPTTAYILSVVIAIVFLLIAVLISLAIKFEGGSNPSDPRKRRMWFWIIAGLTPAANYLIGFLVIGPTISNIMFRQKFMDALAIGTGISLVIYILLGFILSKLNKNGKLGNWF